LGRLAAQFILISPHFGHSRRPDGIQDWGAVLDSESGLRIPNMLYAVIDGLLRAIETPGEDILQSEPPTSPMALQDPAVARLWTIGNGPAPAAPPWCAQGARDA